MSGGIRIREERCRGCSNCIRSCPTGALRVIDGLVRITEDLCIDCGECIRSCAVKALCMNEDEWETVKSKDNPVLMPDPTFYVQIGAYSRVPLMREALELHGYRDLSQRAATAFDVAAFAAAGIIRDNKDKRPYISSYCPAVIRLIQINFPELVGRILPVESPLEAAVHMWKKETGNREKVTLVSPCPAKTALVRNPVGREKSALKYVVSVQNVIRDLLASNIRATGSNGSEASRRWLLWSITGGETRQISAFSDRTLTSLTVSGLRNTIDLLNELELGRLDRVDFIECRACSQGCIGGTGTYESRYLSRLRLQNLDTAWLPPHEEMEVVRSQYEQGIWRLPSPLPVKERAPLSQDIGEAMAKLREMDEIYATLPHIDCGSCGRPSCRALAEDIVRGLGSETDCIFKLRERISSLSEEIGELASKVPHTLYSRRKRKSS